MVRNNFIISFFLILAGMPLYTHSQTDIPDVNSRVITYVGTVIGSTVGRGECWDLADQALTFAHAQFDKTSPSTIYTFGTLYNPDNEKILPGDIIQFENVVVTYKDGNKVYTENYKHHTAIVYDVKENGSLQLAHQNTSFGGRKVALSEFNLINVKKGKLLFYHPIPE
jgi:signal peptidase I